MIRLNDDFCTERLNQMPDFFDYPNKTRNFKLCWPIVLLCGDKELREEEDKLNGVFVWPMPVGQGFVGSYIKYHCFKAEIFGCIQVYPQHLVRVVMDKSRRVA